LIDLPDFSGPLDRIARAVGRLAWRRSKRPQEPLISSANSSHNVRG
jgi:hypothetical protein